MTKNFTKECVLNGNTRHLKEVMKTKKCHMSKKYSRMYIENYIKKTKALHKGMQDRRTDRPFSTL